MKNYKYATWSTLLLWVVSLILYIIFYNCDFWKNILIGLFGGGVLSFITSAIAYRQQRKNTLEKFYNRTNEILHFWSRYAFLEGTEEKLDYFLEYCNFSRFEWDEAFGDMDFFFDRFRKIKYRKYIYDNIYCPIFSVSETISSGERERYLRHSKKNKNLFDICDKEFGEGIENNLDNIGYHLGHFYYRIMYGKRKCIERQKLISSAYKEGNN